MRVLYLPSLLDQYPPDNHSLYPPPPPQLPTVCFLFFCFFCYVDLILII
jgi:hypothetical protein